MCHGKTSIGAVFIVEFRCFYISFLFTAFYPITKFFLPAIRQYFEFSLLVYVNGVVIPCNDLMKTEAVPCEILDDAIHISFTTCSASLFLICVL